MKNSLYEKLNTDFKNSIQYLEHIYINKMNSEKEPTQEEVVGLISTLKEIREFYSVRLADFRDMVAMDMLRFYNEAMLQGAITITPPDGQSIEEVISQMSYFQANKFIEVRELTIDQLEKKRDAGQDNAEESSEKTD